MENDDFNMKSIALSITMLCVLLICIYLCYVKEKYNEIHKDLIQRIEMLEKHIENDTKSN